ncbi:MAG: DNA repair exonuclease [Candidatus Nanoarchaeia archaeon]|nr:DNA repair exonuclease [Candidatus Nanoarchaeia archaeon]
MKLIVFSDTHLGRKNFKVAERENDFFSSFSKVVDYAIESCADAVLHAGDLFDSAKPNINVMIFAIDELKRLKEKNIPFFAISGSHDIGSKDTFLNVLDSIGLCKNLANKRYYEVADESIIMKGEEFKELFVCGIPGKNDIIFELECFKPKIPDKSFSVFLFHHVIDEINPIFSSIKKSMLPKGFDLYVSGHWHERFETMIEDKKLIYPGSTENCDLNEMKSAIKGFFEYDTGKKKAKFVELKIRKSFIHEIDCTGMTPDEITEKMTELLKPSNKEMIFFMLHGRMKSGLKSEINRQKINETAMKNNYLLSKVYLSQLQDAFSEQVVAGKKSIDEIESEFFMAKGFNKEQARLAIKMIGLASMNDESFIGVAEAELKKEGWLG